MTVIMVSAMFENGGNTLHRLLDGHPELLVYPFESQLGTGLAPDHLASLVPPRYRWPELPLDGTPEADYELFGDEELKTYLRSRARSKFRDCGLEMDEAERRQAFLAASRDRPRSRRNVVLAYFQATFSSWRNRSSSGRERLIAGFSPALVLDAARFFADFPDGHLVHVVRHPAAGFADTRRRPFPWPLDRYAWTWSCCQLAALVAQREFSERFHLVRFEDLVADPEATLRPLLKRMGLSWSDACTAPSFNGRRLDNLAPWGVIERATPAADAASRRALSPKDDARLALLTAPVGDLIYGRAGASPGLDRPV